MISVTYEMILKSVLLSAIAGTIAGVLYFVFDLMLALFTGIPKHLRHNKKTDESTSAKQHNVFDFLFTLSIGVAYFLLSYVTVDGAFEIYSIITVFAAFFISRQLMRKAFVKLTVQFKKS